MMNHQLAHWCLEPDISGNNYLSIFKTSLDPSSAYQVQAIVAASVGTNEPYRFSAAVLTGQDDVPAVFLTPKQFPDDPPQWDNYQTRYDACRAAEAWLERNRLHIAALAQEVVDTSRWQLPE